MYLSFGDRSHAQYTPVETAMQLMDRSSLGRDYNAFKSLYSRIERALQFVVNGSCGRLNFY